ncbi:hypothetical protein O1611_g6436 [Lasiodiplodia mahajangana]|uniref:Uncharacterized protein n=1 Tax=Lasiodiplodia mahajangana TaxID=1108764 RepID=A0ACC2JIA2_9PEZI|nr:hypothetical protein O1611_g6436 [Lasiodiplodia mahajangana]
MALRPRKRASNVLNDSNESQRPIMEIPIPIETVTSRLRRFYASSSQVNSSSEDPGPIERGRGHTAAG